MTASASSTPVSVNYTARDYLALRSELIARVKDRTNSQWQGNDANDFGLALIEAFAYMGDILNYYIDRAANEAYILTATQRETLLNLAKMYGYTPTNYVSSLVDVDFTNPNGYSSQIRAAVLEDGVAKIVINSDHPFSTDGTTDYDSIIVSGVNATSAVAIYPLGISNMELDTAVFNGTFEIDTVGYNNIGRNVIQYTPKATLSSLTLAGDSLSFTAEYSGSAIIEQAAKIKLSGVTVGSGDNYNGVWYVSDATPEDGATPASFTVTLADNTTTITKARANTPSTGIVTYSTFNSTVSDYYGYNIPSWNHLIVGQKIAITGIVSSGNTDATANTGFNINSATVASVKNLTAAITNASTTGSAITLMTSKEFAAGDIVSIRGLASLSNPNATAGSYWNITELPIDSVTEDTATITGITPGIDTSGNSTGRATFTTSSPHNFTVGQYITITGVTPDVYNISEVQIIAKPADNQFVIEQYYTDAYGSGGTAHRYKINITASVATTESVTGQGTIGYLYCKQFTVSKTLTDTYTSGGLGSPLVGGTANVSSAEVIFADIPAINQPGGTARNIGSTIVPAGSQLYTQVSTGDGTTNVVFSTVGDVVVPFKETVTQLLVQGEDVSKRAANAAASGGHDIAGELLGSSTGEGNQSFSLKETRVDPTSVKIYVDNGVEFEQWSQVSHIMDFGPSSLVFEVATLSSGTVKVNFGDGISGKIPPKDAAIKAVYVAGGGVIGNIKANTLTSWGVIPGLSSQDEANVRKIAISNPGDAVGGLDPESTDSIRYNAPRALRTLDRAVTIQDFSDLALSVPRVAKANAVSAHRSSVALYVAPIASGSSDIAPGYVDETQTTLSSSWNYIQGAVTEFMANRVQIGTSVSVIPPTYTPCGIELTYVKAPQYSTTAVQTNIKKFILDELSYDNLSFGDVLTPEEIEFKLRQVEGVINARVTAMYRNPGFGTGKNSLVGNDDEIFYFIESGLVLTEASVDATLSALVVSTSPTWSASFSPSLGTYRLTLANGTTSVTVTPTANDTDIVGGAASITVNNKSVASGAASEAISTDVGNTTIVVSVTAGDGVTVNTYKLVLVRAS